MQTLTAQLESARQLASEGNLDGAARLYEAMIVTAPAEASEFLGVYALRRKEWPKAVERLEQTLRLNPGNPMVLENLGFAYLGAGRADRAAEVLQHVVDANPDFFAARLGLGLALRAQGDAIAAVAHLYWAHSQAQQRGFWRDAQSIQPWFLEQVLDASAYVRDQHLGRLMRAAGEPLPRVERFVRSQLGVERVQSPDPRQKPNEHYVPDLPASPWLEAGLFPWSRRLEENFPVILEEYRALTREPGAFESFLDFKSPDQVPKHLGTTGPAPRWDAFFFYRHGERNDANCARCPATAALLEELPLVRLPGMAPEICFSILTPGTHILPHRGDSNLRSVVHLPLIVPEACALKVGGEERPWQEGRVLAFDDTYEHEAWNRSGSERVILLMDAWNPHLADAERPAFTRVLAEFREIGADLDRYTPPAAARA